MHTIDAFENRFKTLNNNDHVLSMGDIVDIFDTGLFNKYDVFCFCQAEKNDFIPTLSFSWKKIKEGDGHQFKVYERKKQIIEDNEKITNVQGSFSKIETIKSSKFKLIISNYSSRDLILFRKLLNCCEIVRNSSLNIRNYSRDKLSLNLQLLKENMSASPNFGIKDLANFIGKKFNLKKMAIQLLPDGQTKILGHNKRSYLLDLLENEYEKYLNECKFTGKPITWKCHDLELIFYHCLIPVIGKSEKPIFINNFVLFWADERFSIDIINSIVELIDTYVTSKYIQNKLYSLLQLQKDVIDNIKRSYFGNRKKQKENFEIFTDKCLKHITTSTYSHSATVRLYNPYNKSLKLFREMKTDWGYRICELNENEYKEIPIRKYRVSLNAFTFLKNSNENSYSYIKNYNKKIPDEYQVKGLKEILKHRNSLSEICFPLFCGKIPFGTINIESTIKNAFDHEIEYLSGIKKALEAFYDISIKSSDAKWLAGRSPVYKNVHELSQQIRVNKDLFTTKQIGILQRLVLLDDRVAPRKTVKLSFIYKELVNWLRTQINEIAIEDALKNIIFDIKNDQNIKYNIFENILLICKNLMNNIIAHSNFERDKFIIVQNDHLRMGVNANLKIFIKTYGSFEDDTFSSLLISPILKNSEYHYGMFLVGMLARKLGGIALISRGDDYSPHTIIEVSIPLKYIHKEVKNGKFS